MLHLTTHLLLDAARMESAADEARVRNKAHDSLYRGRSEESLSGVAPYIFQFAYNTAFSSWYLKTGWGSSWGILVKSAWPMAELHKHFRKFLLVQTDEGKELYFRFYDPRVMRIFLPTCDATQLREFFGPAIDYFIVEDEDPAFALRFFHQNGVLKTERFAVAEQIEKLPEPEPLPPPTAEPLPQEVLAVLQAPQAEHAPDNKENGHAPVPQAPTPPPAPAPARIPDAAPATEAGQSADSPSPKRKSGWNTFN